MGMDIGAGTKDKGRILVVDDESRIREACRMVLEEMGFDVVLAADGEQGLALIADRHFDIILVDLMMPVLSGFDVLAAVREHHPDTVVIVITGYATVEHSIEAMKKGAFDFIPKPFTPDQLRGIVAKSLRYTRALQDIADSKSRLRVVVNRLMDGVMTTDGEQRIVLANPAFLQMTGWAESDVVGRRVEEVAAGVVLQQMIDEALAMPADTFTEIVREHTVPAADGRPERILDVRCAPFRGRTGANLGTIVVLHDITAGKKMERMKSDFVSMVSHEIRGPMNSLLMQIQVILDGLAGEVTAKQREILERASGKIHNLTNMVSELLDLARIEAGLIANAKEELDLRTLLEEQVAFHLPAATAAGLELALEPLPTLPLIQGNPQGLDEVFTNLITNAIKYSPAGGRVTVAAGVDGGCLAVTVRDSGYGIPEEDLEEIFASFYRVKDANTRTIHGTGLGLAIVKSIVTAHRGSIRVESKLGQGSAFTVSLPVNGG
ncbi:response regulator [Desulfoprunum benzoelyticum]|nr:response regulator [Desulfoprunum benzoelyticum]